MTVTTDQPGEPAPLPSLRAGAPGSPVLRILHAGRPVGGRLALATLLGALAIGCSVGLLATSAFLISKASQQPPILHLQVAIVAVRAFGIGRGVFRYAERIVGHDAAFRSLTDLRVAVYDRLAVVAPAGISGYRSGDLLARLVADVDAMLDLHLRVVLPYLVAAVVSIGSVVLVTAFVPAAGVALALALLVGAVLVPAITMRLARRSQQRVAQQVGRLTAETVTLMDGAAELIALGRQGDVLARIRATDAELTRSAARAAVSSGTGLALGTLAQGAAILAAVVFGTQAVISGSLGGVNLALVVLVPLAAYEAVQVLPAAIVTLARVQESARRIADVLDAPDLTPDPAAPEELPQPVGPGTLRLAGFQAGWAPGNWVVAPLHLTVATGESVALVAPSGVGKSTVAAGLVRLAPAVGTATFGRLGAEVDLAQLTGDDVRSVVELVAQDAHLFDTTVAENVRLANRSVSDDDIAALLSELGLADWLAGLPDGVATRVGRFGRAVSGGQKQRIALARGLVADRPVVVADEPTEHLDADNARLVLAALQRHCRDRALILITHNERDAAACDRVVPVHPA